MSTLPHGIVTRKSIAACAGCDRSNVPQVIGWMRFEITESSVTVIPGLPKPLTSFGCWTDYCTGCIESGKMTPASYDHPDNWGYPGWESYRAAGHGTEVPAIIAEMTSEWMSRYGEMPSPEPAPASKKKTQWKRAAR